MLKPEELRMFRAARNMSQTALGEKAGIPQWRVSLIERGVSPTRAEEKALARVIAREVERGSR